MKAKPAAYIRRMKRNKRLFILILVSAFSLIGLVILQLHWIREGAQLKESQFDHRVNMALHKVGRELSRHVAERVRLAKYLDQTDTENTDQARLNPPNHKLIDSLLHAQFTYHHIAIDYKFYIINRKAEKVRKKQGLYHLPTDWQQTPYRGCLDRVLKTEGWDLRICFPDKEEFIWAELASMLALSLLFISLVMSCFAFTIHMILKQKKLSQMTTDFINNMTHELKTPIATVSLASRMLQRDKILSLPEKVMHYARIIEQENSKLTEQVEQVLQIARLEKGEVGLDRNPVSLHEVLLEAVKVIELQVTNRNGQIETQLEAITDDLSADRMHLRNIFLNILDNANKYSPEAPFIKVRTRSQINGIEIAITDNGIGMSKDKQRQAFEKFYRAHTGNVHDVKGFGLGLAYVKMMVEAHGGRIQLESEPGKGTTFTLFFPYPEPNTESAVKK